MNKAPPHQGGAYQLVGLFRYFPPYQSIYVPSVFDFAPIRWKP